MSKGVSYRPKLSPPRGRQLERSYRPYMTCFMVTACIAILICVVFGLTAYNIYNHRFGRTERKFHAGDQVSLWRAADDLTPVFCSSYSVDTENVTDLYLLPKEAEVDPSKHDSFSWGINTQPGHDLYVYQVHYMPEGSVASLSACRDSSSDVKRPTGQTPAEFLVIVGDEHYDEWRKFFNNRHVKHRVVIPRNATCNSSTSLPHLELTVSRADNYYFILIMRDRVPSVHFISDEIHLEGSINRTVYNVSGATSVCYHNQSTCEFPLSWGSKQDIVAQVISGTDEPKTFITDCQVRLPFWVSVFGVAPVCLMLLMSVWCWHLLVRKRNIRSHYRQPVNSQVSNTSYGSMEAAETAPLMGSSSNSSPTGAAHSDHEDDRCASIQD